MVEGDRSRTRARTSGSTLRRPEAALGDVPVSTRVVGSVLARLLRVLPARLQINALGRRRCVQNKLASRPTQEATDNPVTALPLRCRSALVFNVRVSLSYYSMYCTVVECIGQNTVANT